IQLAQVRVGPTGDQQRVFIEQDFSDEHELNRFIRDLKRNFEKTLRSRYEMNTTPYDQENNSTTNFKKSGVVVVEEPGEEPKTYPQPQQTRTEKKHDRSPSTISREKLPHRARSYSDERRQYSKSYTDIRTHSQELNPSKSFDKKQKSHHHHHHHHHHHRHHHNKNSKRGTYRYSSASTDSIRVKRKHRSLSKSKTSKRDKSNHKSWTFHKENPFYNASSVKKQNVPSRSHFSFINNYSKHINQTKNGLYPPPQTPLAGFFPTSYTPFPWENKGFHPVTREPSLYNDNRRSYVEHNQRPHYSHQQQPSSYQKKILNDENNYKRIPTPAFVPDSNIQWRFKARDNDTLSDISNVTKVTRQANMTPFSHLKSPNTPGRRPSTHLPAHMTTDNNLIQRRLYAVTPVINQNGLFFIPTQQLFDQPPPKPNIINKNKPPLARPPTNIGLPTKKQYQPPPQQQHGWPNRAQSRLLQYGPSGPPQPTIIEQSFIYPHSTEQRVFKARPKTGKLSRHQSQPHQLHHQSESSSSILSNSTKNVDYLDYGPNFNLQSPHRHLSFCDINRTTNGFNPWIKHGLRPVKYVPNMMRHPHPAQTFLHNPLQHQQFLSPNSRIR
ncbi:unnamed protein product, partial [Didymodactylos carnosus]